MPKRWLKQSVSHCDIHLCWQCGFLKLLFKALSQSKHVGNTICFLGCSCSCLLSPHPVVLQVVAWKDTHISGLGGQLVNSCLLKGVRLWSAHIQIQLTWTVFFCCCCCCVFVCFMLRYVRIETGDTGGTLCTQETSVIICCRKPLRKDEFSSLRPYSRTRTHFLFADYETFQDAI